MTRTLAACRNNNTGRAWPLTSTPGMLVVSMDLVYLPVKLTGKDRVIDMLAGRKRMEQLDCFGGLASSRGRRGRWLVEAWD